MAGGEMGGWDWRAGGKLRIRIVTEGPPRDQTSRMEPAARREVDRARRVADHCDRRRSSPWHEPGNRLEETACVGMTWIGEQRICCRYLDDAPEVHDGDFLAHVPDDRHVVCDQEDAQAEVLA